MKLFWPKRNTPVVVDANNYFAKSSQDHLAMLSIFYNLFVRAVFVEGWKNYNTRGIGWSTDQRGWKGG